MEDAIRADAGRGLVEVMGEDASDRWQIRVHRKNALIGGTILVKYEDGHTVPYCVVSILEQRQEKQEDE